MHEKKWHEGLNHEQIMTVVLLTLLKQLGFRRPNGIQAPFGSRQISFDVSPGFYKRLAELIESGRFHWDGITDKGFCAVEFGSPFGLRIWISLDPETGSVKHGHVDVAGLGYWWAIKTFNWRYLFTRKLPVDYREVADYYEGQGLKFRRCISF